MNNNYINKRFYSFLKKLDKTERDKEKNYKDYD